MNIKILSLVTKMLVRCTTPVDYISFVKNEVPRHLSGADQVRAARMCKLAFAISRTPYYELLKSRSAASFRRAIGAMCSPEGALRMAYNGKMYRLVNLRFSANLATEEDIQLILEALEMTMAPVMVDEFEDQ